MGSGDHEGETSGREGSWAQSLWATRRQESHGFLFETDFELRFRYVSPGVTEICGYEAEEWLGERVEAYLSDRESIFTLQHEMQALFKGQGSEARFHLNVRHKEDRAVALELVCRVCWGEPGKGRIYGFATDAGVRKSAETQLQLSDQILNTIDTMVLVANGQGQVIYVSPSVTRVLGFEEGEVLGYGWWRLVEEDRRSRKQRCDEYARGARGETAVQSQVREMTMRDRAGNLRWMIWQDVKGPQDLIIGVGQDITEHRKMNEALENSTRKLRAIFEATVEGMMILDDGLRYVDANPAACRILGRRREEIVGQEVGTFSTEPQSVRELFQEGLSRDTSGGEGEVRLEDGKLRQVEYTAKANILPGMHLAVMRDVTERKRLEQQLQQAQKMEAVGQLAGGVAHDFNNMLTVIRGYSELLQRQLPPQSEYRRYADSILNASEKATMTTQQLLAFSRRQVIQPREINVNHVAHDMGKLLQKLIGEDIQLRMSLDEKLGTVRADAGQMGQILVNLAVNARDAMPNGGAITVETQNVKVDGSYARTHLKVDPGDYVMMSVTDTGCGMSPEVLSRIFEPFFTTKSAGKGTGLGLSTVYGIIEQAGGAVYVYSEPGEGTSFKLYFPRADKVAERPTEEPDEAGKAAWIVVIDDDLESGQMIATFLKKHGYQVLGARSGGEAVQVCERHRGRIEVVISDITMPGADGLDIQGYFGIEHPETKVIYISGYTKRSLRDRGILTPDAAFLQKPFRWEDLRVLIEEVTGARERPQVQ